MISPPSIQSSHLDSWRGHFIVISPPSSSPPIETVGVDTLLCSLHPAAVLPSRQSAWTHYCDLSTLQQSSHLDSLVENNMLVHLPVDIGEYHHCSVSILHQPDVNFANFLCENLPSGRSWFARQISDVKGRTDVVLKPPLYPASCYLPACRR